MNLCYEKNSFLSDMMTHTWICYHLKRKVSGNRTVRFQGPPFTLPVDATPQLSHSRFPPVIEANEGVGRDPPDPKNVKTMRS